MKSTLLLALAITTFSFRGLAQGTITINPVPVTNGLTGVLADSSFVAALYYGPVGAPEGSLMLLGPASALVNGFAQFGSQTGIPGIATGASAELAVRAWSSGYPSYEAALASGLPSVLVGKPSCSPPSPEDPLCHRPFPIH